MQPLELDGAWYGANTPRGSWVALYPTGPPDPRIQTSRGRLEWPGQNVLYLDCADVADVLCAAGAVKLGAVDTAILWNGQKWIPLCPAYGTSPVAFGPDGTLYVSSVGEVDNVRIFDALSGAQVGAVTQRIGSRGIAAVDAPIDEVVARRGIHAVDQWYGQFGLGEYVEIGGYRIGQGITSRDGLEVAGRGPLVPDGLCTFIHAKAQGDQFAVSTWKTTGRLVLLWPTRAEIDALKPRVIDPPIVVIVPPVDKDKPKEPATMNLPAEVKAVIARYAAQFPVPQMPKDATKSDDAFENVCRAWCYKLAQTIVAITGNPSWGVKNAGGGRPQSKDALAFNGPNLFGFDLLNGVGTGHPSLVGDAQGADITGQTFMPVDAVNWLAGTHTDGGTPTTPPAAGSLDALVGSLIAQAVAPLKATIAALQTQVDELKARPVGGGNASIDGVRVAFESNRGRFMRDDWSDDAAKFDRVQPEGGETFTLWVQP